MRLPAPLHLQSRSVSFVSSVRACLSVCGEAPSASFAHSSRSGVFVRLICVLFQWWSAARLVRVSCGPAVGCGRRVAFGRGACAACLFSARLFAGSLFAAEGQKGRIRFRRRGSAGGGVAARRAEQVVKEGAQVEHRHADGRDDGQVVERRVRRKDGREREQDGIDAHGGFGDLELAQPLVAYAAE